jgi:hypothetical protein
LTVPRHHGYFPGVRKNGETNPGTYLVGALVLAAGFYIYHVAPVYWGNLEAKEAVAQGVGVYILQGEQAALDGILFRLNSNKDVKHLEVNEDGVEEWKDGYGLTEDNVTVKLDESTRKLTIRVEYDRYVDFAPLKKRKKFHLVAEKIEKLNK